LNDIIVTARKQKESIIDVPETVSVLSGAALGQLGIQNFVDYATKIPDLSFSYGTGSLGYSNSRTVAIRGISGAGTTAIYLDDTPISEAMDPRVLDTARIEVLKGPQGTLFGEGSLGGAIRLISQRPSFDEQSIKYAVSAGGTSYAASPDYGANFVSNTPVNSTLAIRVSGFVSHDGGFLTRTFPRSDGSLTSLDNQGANLSYGGSVTALFHFNERWEAELRVLGQLEENHGTPTAYAPVPEFTPSSLTLDRSSNLQEYANEHWVMPTLQLNYNGVGWNAVSATSFLNRQTSEAEDDTEGTLQATRAYYGFTPVAPLNMWGAEFRFKRLTEELRANIAPGSRVSGTVGAYFSDTDTVTNLLPVYVPGIAAAGLFPSDLGWRADINSVTKEDAIFGEAYMTPIEHFTVTAGLRKYWLRQSFDSFEDGLYNGGESNAVNTNVQNGVSPKLAVEYKFAQDASVYAAASKGFRQGGAGGQLPSICDGDLAALGLTPAQASRYGSDTVWSYELGSKAQVLDRRVLLTGSLYLINWSDIQQAVFLPTCTFTFTSNAGSARSRGFEFEASGQVVRGLDIRAGIGYDNARITEQGHSASAPGTFVHEVPELTATAAATYTHSLTSTVDGFASMDFSHVGSSTTAISSFAAPLTRPAYNVLNVRLGVRRSSNELSLYANNVTDERANLGDLNPLGFARYDSNGAIEPRVALLRPFALGLRFQHGF
jgi:outer membrane receptor protein involved in Fe transport